MRYNVRFLVLGIIFGLVFFISLLIGRYSIFSRGLIPDSLGMNILLNIRLPRILTAAMLGMALSVAGATFQSAFKNPLVEPSIIGVTQGAAFGAAFAILFLASSPITIKISATIFGLLALLLTYMLSSSLKYGGKILRLVLVGIAVSAVFAGGVGIMKTLADPMRQLPELTFWLMGGLSGVVWRDFFYILPLFISGIIALLILRWRINLLTLKDDIVLSLGTDPGKLRALVATFAVMATAAVVSVAGIIAWVGLIVPHIARKLFGVDNSRVIPASLLLGAILMIAFDSIARTISAGEIPLGIVTSLTGAPLLIFMLSRRGGGSVD